MKAFMGTMVYPVLRSTSFQSFRDAQYRRTEPLSGLKVIFRQAGCDYICALPNGKPELG